MFKSYSMELAGRTLTVEVGRVAKQASGAAFMHYGDTVVLSTATASDKPREGIDFFPLSVEYEEKLYAVGKIPGGFNKREGKASENSVLTSRVIDRPMRPLFPKDYRNDVTLDNIVMSVDQDCSPELTAMLGSAIATCISDIPFDGPCATTQIGMVDGELVVNPTQAQKQASDMALTVASTREKVIMIEAGANEVAEDIMIEAIFKAHSVNQEVIKFIDTIVAECGKPKHTYISCAVPEELFAAIREIVPQEEMEVAVFTDDKQTREDNIRSITAKLEEAFADKEEWLAVLGEAIYQYQKKTVRKMILKDHKRPDGRAVDQIRPLAAEIDMLPRVHGSAMFTRGQTQILNICTLAPLSESQRLDGIDDMETSKRYMHHYPEEDNYNRKYQGIEHGFAKKRAGKYTNIIFNTIEPVNAAQRIPFVKAACKCDPNRHQQKYRVEQNHSGYCDIAEQDLTFALQGTCFSEHDFSSPTPRIYKGFLLIQNCCSSYRYVWSLQPRPAHRQWTCR